MSGRDNDEHGSYPNDKSRWQRDRGAHEPLNPSADASSFDTSALDTVALEVPVDLAAVQADDALLNMLGSAEFVSDRADAELVRVLTAWRRDIESEPVGELVDPDTALKRVTATRRPTPRKHPLLGPFAAAAAVLVVIFSAVGLVAKSAEPGDELWSLTRVLYTDYARSKEAAEQVKSDLAEADTALKEGDTSQAEESLDRAQQQLPKVDEKQDRTELAKQHDWLEDMLEQRRGEKPNDKPDSVPPAQPPATTSTPAPAPAPVPVPPSDSSTPPPPPEPPTVSSTPPTTPSSPQSTLISAPPEEEDKPEPKSSEATPKALPEASDTTTSSQAQPTS